MLARSESCARSDAASEAATLARNEPSPRSDAREMVVASRAPVRAPNESSPLLTAPNESSPGSSPRSDTATEAARLRRAEAARLAAWEACAEACAWSAEGSCGSLLGSSHTCHIRKVVPDVLTGVPRCWGFGHTCRSIHASQRGAMGNPRCLHGGGRNGCAGGRAAGLGFGGTPYTPPHPYCPPSRRASALRAAPTTCVRAPSLHGESARRHKSTSPRSDVSRDLVVPARLLALARRLLALARSEACPRSDAAGRRPPSSSHEVCSRAEPARLVALARSEHCSRSEAARLAAWLARTESTTACPRSGPASEPTLARSEPEPPPRSEPPPTGSRPSAP